MRYDPRGPIPEWEEQDRPREKLIKRGTAALTDAELLAILISSGTRKLSALDVARQILKRYGSLGALARAGVQELMAHEGIGPAKAITLVAAFELGRRKGMEFGEEVKITASSVAANYLTPRLVDLDHEVGYLLFLNQNNVIKAEKLISQGGASATIIDPKIVFREALNHLATGIIIAHNHPSGNLKPSRADIVLTHKLYAGGKLLDIAVLDHLIISRKGYFSFADEGMMEAPAK